MDRADAIGTGLAARSNASTSNDNVSHSVWRKATGYTATTIESAVIKGGDMVAVAIWFSLDNFLCS